MHAGDEERQGSASETSGRDEKVLSVPSRPYRNTASATAVPSRLVMMRDGIRDPIDIGSVPWANRPNVPKRRRQRERRRGTLEARLEWLEAVLEPEPEERLLNKEAYVLETSRRVSRFRVPGHRG